MYRLSQPSRFMGAPQDADPLYGTLLRGLDPPGLLVDLGSGRGRFLAHAQRKGFDVLGVEQDAGSVADCIRQGVPAVQADIFAWLRESDVAADAISAIHVVEHFEPARVSQLLTGIKARLRPGGKVMLVTPNFRDWSVVRESFWLDPTHVRPYPPGLLVAMAGEVGLSAVSVATTAGVRRGLRARALLPAQRLRYGAQFGKLNAVVILAASAPSIGAATRPGPAPTAPR